MSALREFVDGLGADDLSVAIALQEALRLADAEGRFARGPWETALAEALERAAAHLHDAAPGPSAPAGAAAEGVGSLVDRRVLPAFESAGLLAFAAPPPDGEAAEPRLAFEPGVWEDVRGDRDRILADLADTVTELEARRAVAYAPSGHAGPGVEAPVAPPEDLSTAGRFWAEKLTKIYRRRRVVSEVDLEVRQGEIVGLLGPNGAGKTTTFYMMVGLIPPDGGSVCLDGKDLTGVPMYKRARMGVGYLAQEPSIFRKLSVEDNVRAILETLKLPRKEEKARLEGLLQELGLVSLRDAKAYSLSGGERRRLEITRALVQRPKFLLLDEPFAGIDPIAVNDIQQIVRGLKSRGIGAVISDHNVEQTLEIVDRAYIMYEGRIRVSGTVSELVWNDEVAEIYLGPTLTARMRGRFERPAFV